VDTSLFDGEKNRSDARGLEVLTRYDLENNNYILYVSALWQYKNQDKLIEAHARLVKATGREIVLVLAGKGTGNDPSYLERVHALPTSLGTGHLVRFAGQLKQQELRYLYASATAFVFPSSYESFGNPIFESWASGIPIATSNVHSFPEIVGDAGLLFDPNDAASFDRALHAIVGDEQCRKMLIEKGLQRVKAFTWERCIMRTLSLLEDVKRFV
jgi:glycosyltransferase involved in cell wall biosynthesis